jgi:hypothetical protein
MSEREFLVEIKRALLIAMKAVERRIETVTSEERRPSQKVA